MTDSFQMTSSATFQTIDIFIVTLTGRMIRFTTYVTHRTCITGTWVVLTTMTNCVDIIVSG